MCALSLALGRQNIASKVTSRGVCYLGCTFAWVAVLLYLSDSCHPHPLHKTPRFSQKMSSTNTPFEKQKMKVPAQFPNIHHRQPSLSHRINSIAWNSQGENNDNRRRLLHSIENLPGKETIDIIAESDFLRISCTVRYLTTHLLSVVLHGL